MVTLLLARSQLYTPYSEDEALEPQFNFRFETFFVSAMATALSRTLREEQREIAAKWSVWVIERSQTTPRSILPLLDTNWKTDWLTTIKAR